MKTIKGICSYYGLDKVKENLNDYTSSNEWFNPKDYTCAMPYSSVKGLCIPFKENKKPFFGSLIKVTWNNNKVFVRHNDTGPKRSLKRIIDITPIAAKSLFGDLSKGIWEVEIELSICEGNNL